MAAAHRMVSIGLCLVAGMLMFAEHVDAQDPRVDLSVFGSGSFKTALSVGSAPTVRNKRFQRVSVSGANAEVSLHDRNEAACSAKKRWVLYASKGSFRSYRPGTTGGFVVTADKSRFLKDVNVGGAFETKTIQLQGVGNRVSDSADGEPLLIGKKSLGHLKMGYNKGNAWIQSVRTHLSLNPFRNHITIGTTKPKKRLTVNGHMRVDNKLVLGGASGTGSISATHLRFANGGGWYMTDKNYVRTVGGLPVFTKGAGKFMGNVGVGTLPKFPIFRLQVHGNVESKHGGVMVTDKADKGLTIGQTKEGALLRSWKIDTKKHEAMLIEAGPLLIQPRSGIVLFGTTVRKKRMHLHIRGNLYIHGHMFAMKNLHVRDHANLKHLYMPSLNLKNKPQSPDGDTLVLGHMKKKKKGASEAAPWETGKKKKVITGINLRFGFHQDYTWIQVHGKRKGGHEPLAINPLGNTVSIGSVKPDKRFSMYANGHGYVLGTLYVKVGGASKKLSTEAELAKTSMTSQEAMEAMQQAEVREHMLAKTAQSQNDMLRSRLTLINVPEKLQEPNENKNELSINKMSQMIHKVLSQQEATMAKQDNILKAQTEKIAKLRSTLAQMATR